MLWSLTTRIDTSVSAHAHALVEIICCTAGSGRVELASHSVALQAGRSLVIGPEQRHRLAFAPGEAAELKFICVDLQAARAHLAPVQGAQLGRAGVSVADFAPHSADGHCLRAALALLPEAPVLAQAPQSAQAQLAWGVVGLIAALHRQAGQQQASAPRSRHQPAIAALQAWLAGQLHQSVSIEQAAAYCGLSRSLLTREFRKATGQSLVEYCNARRLEQAARSLADPSLSITDVALACGFGNLSHFHHQFKARYGLSPGAFRQLGPSGR